MSIAQRVQYYRRIFPAYLTGSQSHLTFWHDQPQENLYLSKEKLGGYYMNFPQKAEYAAHRNAAGIPMLDYQGKIGLHYNPIAIAQWGLGNYNLFHERKSLSEEKSESRNHECRQKFVAASDWLCTNLEQNGSGIWVWNHHFGWEYRTTLKAPWYSALAQGQGISLLVRGHAETGDSKYLDAAERAFTSFLRSTTEGGVTFVDQKGNTWFEEYIVSPPTHILNGFIWAAWGVWDYFLATKDSAAAKLYDAAVQTLRANLSRYDLGWWSLYEQSGTALPMVASSFYHRLHIVQLRVMYRLTGDKLFADYAGRWQEYSASWSKRVRALCYKSVFKLCYY
ncbi:MAG: D-glucuronyl C5-epimerase family protein [Terriglobales bacterium]